MPIRRFTVAEYHRMIDAGILTEDDNVELLKGWIVPKMARNPPHDGTIDVLEGAIAPQLLANWFLRVQSAITTDDSEPEPDLAAVRGHRRTFMQRHPGPADIGMLIEVADPTLAQDRQVKGPLYALARVPGYWIVNLGDRCIEVYTDPDGTPASPRYNTRKDYRPGDTIPLILDAQLVASFAVNDLLP